MKRLYSFIFLFLFVFSAKGQKTYVEAIRQGDDAYSKGFYNVAINKYFAAEAFDPNKSQIIKLRLKYTFDKIESLRKDDSISKNLALKNLLASRKSEQNALKEAKIARANELMSDALRILPSDPTLSLRLTEQSIKEFSTAKNRALASLTYQENTFYKILIHGIKGLDHIAFSPDGRRILTGSFDQAARLWDLEGNLVKKFNVNSFVASVAFSPDGKKILTGSWDQTARIWDLEGNLIREFKGHTDWVTSVAFSPDGKKILTGTYDQTARLWDLEGNLEKEFKWYTKFATSVAFSPDGKEILTSSYDQTARLLDLEGNLIREFKGHTDRVTSVLFLPMGKKS